jgi:hypothetical protein
MANYNIYLAQLTDEKQKHVRQCLKMLRIFLRKAEGRLTLYESENAEAGPVCFGTESPIPRYAPSDNQK